MEKITANHPNSYSANLTVEDIAQLKQIFSEVMKEIKLTLKH